MKLNKFVDFALKQLGSHFKNNEKIPGKKFTLKKPGEVLSLRKIGNPEFIFAYLLR